MIYLTRTVRVHYVSAITRTDAEGMLTQGGIDYPDSATNAEVGALLAELANGDLAACDLVESMAYEVDSGNESWEVERT